MRILHILDHSLPLHSGYVFRTLAILREQRALGWQTLQLTTPRHGTAGGDVEDVDGWRFHRTLLGGPAALRCRASVICARDAGDARGASRSSHGTSTPTSSTRIRLC